MPYTPLSIRWDSLVHGMPKAILLVNKELELNAWNLERFLIACRKTKTKVVNIANQKKEKSLKNQGEPKLNQANRPSAGKLSLILVLHLIGRECGTSFLDQSQS